VNSLERVQKRMAGEGVDRAPNFSIMMTFAAHHIGRPLSEYYKDYRVLGEANLAVLSDFDLDIVQVISDPYREAADFGARIEFPEDNLPLCKAPLVQDRADIARLRVPDPLAGGRMTDRVEGIRYLRERVGGEVPVMGWVEGGLAEAADLRGVSTVLLDLYDDPAWTKDLLEICVEAEIAFARAQVAAGADIIGMGDAIASQVSAAMYREFALPYERRIFAAVKEMGALCRLHICGDITHILPDVLESGADIVDVDWMVDFGYAAEVCGDRAVVCGNYDPVSVMLQGKPARVRQAVFDCLEMGGDRCLIMAGCEVPDGTPRANLLAQAEALRDAGRGVHFI
jgi:MtaA/CmuA family methyltransferase